MNDVLFLDRDGTINEDRGYVTDPSNLVLLPGVADAIARARACGFKIVIVSNQSAIGRGMASAEDVERTNQRTSELLLEENADALVDAVHYCPHAPEHNCSCRKPQPGLISTAQQSIDFCPERCWIVGDKLTDALCGKNAGLPEHHCVLLTDSAADEAGWPTVAASLPAAVELIVSDL